MPRTPNPTPDEILDEMSLMSARVSLAQAELILRIQENLPGVITKHNQAENYTPRQALPTGQKVEPAPAKIYDDNFIGKILVGITGDAQAEGIGGAFSGVSRVTIYVVDQALKSGHQVKVQWELIELIRGVLFTFAGGVLDSQDRQVWRKLTPGPYMLLDADFAPGYSGTQSEFTLLQMPAEDSLWG
ncbi:MAG TPA: hypothetical protein VGB45_08385 [Abditibacterium sp.]|jgi:hypothetical protein